MQALLIYSNLSIGAWLIFNSFIFTTQNIRSTIYFKVMPFFGGLVLLLNGLKLLGII